MKKRTGILGVLIAIVLLGIGYAAITQIPLTINGSGTVTPNDENFKVVYSDVVETTKSPATITVTKDNLSGEDKTTTEFTIADMTKVGDTVTLTYTIKNKSEVYKADLKKASDYLTVTGDTDYFTVTSEFTESTLAIGGTTTQTVTVTAAKTPADAAKSVTITLKLTADAVE